MKFSHLHEEIPIARKAHAKALAFQVQASLHDDRSALDTLTQSTQSYAAAVRVDEIAEQVRKVDANATWLELSQDGEDRFLYAYDSEGNPLDLGGGEDEYGEEGFGSATLAEEISEEDADDVFTALGRTEIVDGAQRDRIVNIDELGVEVNRRSMDLGEAIASLSAGK